MEYYYPHSAVRLCKISSSEWRLSHLLQKKEFNIDPLVAAVLVLFSGGESKESFLIKTKRFFSPLEQKKLPSIIKLLSEKSILVKKDDEESNRTKILLDKWKLYGWEEAADYYLSSLSFPFIEGTVYDYNRKDKNRMESYYTAEPDFNRSKEYPSPKDLIKLPTVEESLEDPRLTINISDSLNNTNKSLNANISNDDIFKIFSITFGALKQQYHSIPNVAPNIRKTSPSGGSRHPTEGYAIIANESISGISGVFHYSLSKNSLEKIHEPISFNKYKEIFPGLCRFGTIPKLTILLTSLFERNMYRYREPRTFRTLFIDIGHISETLRCIANALGYRFTSHAYVDFSEAEKLLKINPLEEGVFYSVGVN